MGSPRKSGTPESGSPRLARFFPGNVIRRRSPGISEKSSDEQQDARDPISSPKSSGSSSNHFCHRHRSITAEVSPLGRQNTLQENDDCFKENLAGSANNTGDSSPIPLWSPEKLGGILPGTPSSGYQSLPDPSPKARFTLSRIRSPLSFQSTDKRSIKNGKTNESPSTMGSRSVGGNQLHQPDLDHSAGQHLNSDSLNTPKSQGLKSAAKKRTEKRNNRKPRETQKFAFLSFNKPHGSLSIKSKRSNGRSHQSGTEEPSSPLLLYSLSDQIKNPHFASDRSETIVFFKEKGGPPNDEEDYSESEQGEFVEVVQLSKRDSRRMRLSVNGSVGEQDDFFQIMRRDRSASELHSLCALMATIDDVLRARSFFVGRSLEDASGRDYKGETPMHAFSNNRALAFYINGNPTIAELETKGFLALYREPSFDQESANKLHDLVEMFLLEELLPSFPGAMMIQDNNGHIPFEVGLLDWIATSQNTKLVGISEKDYYSTYLSYTQAVSDAVSHAWRATSTSFLTAMSKMTESDCQIGNEGDVERCDGPADIIGDLHQASSKDELTGGDGGSSQVKRKTNLSPHPRFCLEMLSLIVDQLEKITKIPSESLHSRAPAENRRMRRGIQQLQDLYGPLDLAAQVVERIASIPNLLETIFYIKDDIDMEFALSTSIIRRVMMNKQSIGPWLTTMLQDPDGRVSRRAIDYLQTVSKLCDQEKNKGERSKSVRTSSCDNIIDEVSRLPDFIPSLLSLGESGMEEVSTTRVVSNVLDALIAKPFVATVVLCDAIFLALMIVGFRYAVNGMIMGDSLETVLSWIYLANIGIFYFIIGEIGKIVSLFLLSSHSRKYFLSFWHVIDVLAVLLATTSSVAMRWRFSIHEEGLDNANFLRSLLAITTGFMWLRVLSFLKSINIQLATFILAIITIMKDIFFFCVILLTLVVSFAQMFYTLLAPSSCAADESSDQQECKQTEYLLQVYIMLLGDFGNVEREAFTTGFSVFLVVLYSFLVTAILLNVLIAIASDSYDKCLLKSQKLFGRARVMLVAELVSFQSLLRKRDQQGDSSLEDRKKGQEGVYSKWWMSGSWSWTRKWSRGSVLFFMLSMFVTLVWTMAELVGFARGESNGSIVKSLSSVFVNIILYITIILFLDRNSPSVKGEASGENEWSNSLQRLVLRVLGASGDGKKDHGWKQKKVQEEWHGRVQFLHREMDRIAERQTELVNDQTDNFQSIVNQSEYRVRAELIALEERFKQTNVSIVSAVEELKALISLAGSTASSPRSPVPEEVNIHFG